MATYFVRQSGGSDGNDGLSFAQGWATIQHAADTVASGGGDLVLICADGTHAPTATIDFDTNAGATENPNIFRGASAIGVDDGTVATVSGSGISSAPLFNLSIASLFMTLENLRLTAGTTFNINLGTALNDSFVNFINVRIDNASGAGVFNGESDAETVFQFINCEIDNNGADGIDSAGASRGGLKIINCSIHNNTGDGVEETSGVVSKAVCIKTLFYANGGHGLNINNDLRSTIIDGCVFFNNTLNGIEIGGTTINDLVITNCIFRSNGGYGIDTNGGSLLQFAYADFNCFSNNTSGDIDINGGTPPGDNNVIDNPDFTSETGGSEDFTLQAGSPCLDVGLGYDG